jgi:hypothetical protein
MKRGKILVLHSLISHYRRLEKKVLKLTNKLKEEDAKEELKRLIVLGSIYTNNHTSKLPRTDKINFDVKTIIDPQGYSGGYDFDSPRKEFTHHNRHDFK